MEFGMLEMQLAQIMVEIENIRRVDFDETQRRITDTLHIAVPEFYYVPKGMEFDKATISDVTQMAVIRYRYNDNFVYFSFSGK